MTCPGYTLHLHKEVKAGGKVATQYFEFQLLVMFIAEVE